MVDAQPHVDVMQHTVEQLQGLGQGGSTGDAQHVIQQHGELRQQVEQQRRRLEQAVNVRQQYYTNKADLETCLKVCKENMESVNGGGVPMAAKLDKYKVGYLPLKS